MVGVAGQICVKLGAGGIDSMTSADSTDEAAEQSSSGSSNSPPRNPISIDMLCKVCVLVLVGIEVTSGDFVHLL